MKTKILKFGPYMILGLIFAILVILNIFWHDHWLDSDMAAEMMFSGILGDTGHIFATPEWYYSTEFRFLYTQLIMAPLFSVFDSWHVIRGITNILFYVFMLASYFYFVKPLKLDKGLTVLTAAVLLLPFSETMMTHMQMGNTYMSHVIIIFLFYGMFLRLAGRTAKTAWGRLLLLAGFVALAFICGVSGVRYLLALQCPLVLTAVIYLVQTQAFQSFRREMTREHCKKLFATEAMPYLAYSVLGAVGGVLGYGINVLWVSKQYVFQTYDATNFIAIYQGELWDRLQNAMGSLLMLFGYIPEVGFLSLRGLISMISFVVLGILVFCTVKSMKRCSGVRYFQVLFLVVAFFLNVFVFVFTTSTMVPRYYITVLIFALPVLAFYLEQEKLPLDRRAVLLVLSGCLLLASVKVTLSFITADKNEAKRSVAAFLKENDYTFGYATYTNGNIITELTDGAVEIANIWDPVNLNYFKWSSPMKYYEENYHEGEAFLLLTSQEAAEFAGTQVVQQGETVYEDGAYIVYVYDSAEELLRYKTTDWK